MIGLGTKAYNGPSMGRKMYGSSKTVGQKLYGASPKSNKPHISSHPDSLYHNSHNSNIQYVPFGTTKNHLYVDKLTLHNDPVKKHDGNLTRTKFATDDDELPPAVAARKQKLFK